MESFVRPFTKAQRHDFETARLQLRPRTDADMESYLAMAADPEVTRYVSPNPYRAPMQKRRLLTIAACSRSRAALGYAFTTMDLEEVVALTTVSNIRSQRAMQRLGMTHDPHDDFDRPSECNVHHRTTGGTQ